jgi:hypothetical protein
MRWSLADGTTLVSLGPTKTAVVYQMQNDIPPGPYRALEEFALMRGEQQLKRFETQTWTIDDDMGVTSHAVIDGELRCLTVIRNYALRTEAGLRVDEACELRGLTLL